MENIEKIKKCKTLDELFELWKGHNENNPIKNIICGKTVTEKVAFTYDGVLYLPEGKHQQWTDVGYKRVLFMLKDDNQCDNDRWDAFVREWLVNGNEKNLNLEAIRKGQNIFRPLGRWLLGIQSALEGKVVTYADTSDDSIKEHIRNNPMAIIECKKQPGGTYLYPKVLKKYIERDADFIKKEIELLKPNIIICCDKRGIIFRNIVHLLGGDKNSLPAVKVRDNILVLNSYHPSFSYRGYSASERIYNYVINSLLPLVICDKLICETLSLKEISPCINWNVWPEKDEIYLNIQYKATKDIRIGFDVSVKLNYFWISLTLWGNIDENILTEIFGEEHKWYDITITGNKNLLESTEVSSELSLDSIVGKVVRWQGKLHQWLIDNIN